MRIKKERKRKIERERERKRDTERHRDRELERERDRNKVEINTYLFEKWNKQFKLGCFRQNLTQSPLHKSITQKSYLV